MGISYDSGKLANFAALDNYDNRIKKLSEDVGEQERNTPSINIGHGWTSVSSDLVVDDIYMMNEFTKGTAVVYFSDANFIVGEEPFLYAKKKADIEQFLKDFGLTADIEKNAKIVQVS